MPHRSSKSNSSEAGAREGVPVRYRARVVPGPHPEIHALLRAKYGIADRWVRLVGADDEFAAPVALEPIE